MVTGLIVFHVIVCILLTTIVLLQFGKGAEAGAMMGGGGASQNVFTTSSRGNFFTKLTTVLAILFMANSIALTVLKSGSSDESVFDSEAPIAAPLNSDALQTEETEAKGATKEEVAQPAPTPEAKATEDAATEE